MTLEKLLSTIPEKSWHWAVGDANTTSRQFKRDLFQFFNNSKFRNKIALEIGCYFCHTTIVLASLFKRVYALQEVFRPEAAAFIAKYTQDNITLLVHDMYGGSPIPIEHADVILIDAVHTYDAVKSDVANALKLRSSGKKYFIFDDYGCCEGVKKGIDELCQNNTLKKIQGIGYKKGDNWNLIQYPLLDDEGVICIEV